MLGRYEHQVNPNRHGRREHLTFSRKSGAPLLDDGSRNPALGETSRVARAAEDKHHIFQALLSRDGCVRRFNGV